MPETRVCEVCPAVIPSFKAKNVTVCSVACKFKRKEQKRQQAQTEQKEKRDAKAAGDVLFHNCLYFGIVDPFIPEKCLCRKRVTREQAEELVLRGEALDLDTRLPVFAGSSIVQISRAKRTPRSATVERPHLERLTEKPRKASKQKDKSIEELQAAVAKDKAARFEEEALRLEIYNELTVEAQREWIVEVSADLYDAAEREAFGRPGLFFTAEQEMRTEGGIGVKVERIVRDEK